MAEAVLLKQILGELTRNAEQIRQEELEGFADQIQKAKRVFVAGAGRSGFVARAFSNRLMHLGLTVYFVGEPTTPSIQEGDLLVIASGSGGKPEGHGAESKEAGSLPGDDHDFPPGLHRKPCGRGDYRAGLHAQKRAC